MPHLAREKYPYDDFTSSLSTCLLLSIFSYCFCVCVGRAFFIFYNDDNDDNDDGDLNEMTNTLF